jgi:purine-nucleoside phosphorylase
MKKLYGDFDKQDWLDALRMSDGDIPEVLVLHGEWDFAANLKRWAERLGPEVKRPLWNILLGKYESTRLGYSNVFGGPFAAGIAHPMCVMGTTTLLQTGYFGGLSMQVDYGDILIVSQAEMADSASESYLPGETLVEADPGLIEESRRFCESKGYPYQVGSIISTGAFCLETEALAESWSQRGHLGVDMETAATYAVASRFGKKALALLNLSDHLIQGDTFYNYSESRKRIMKETDQRIVEIALYLATQGNRMED